MAELSIRQFVHRAGGQRRIPVSGTFELTPRCNFNCRMCYIHMTPEEQRRIAPERDAAWWLDMGRQAVKAGMIYLLITGGEPFLRPDFVTIYTEMVKMGVLVSVNTNASCLTPEILEAFQKHPPEGVNVTLYGASEETYRALCGIRGGYETVVRNIDAMREAGVRVRLNTTFTTCNAGDMEALIAFAEARNLPIRTTGYTFPPTRNGHEMCDVCLSPEEQANINARFEFRTSKSEKRLARRDSLEAGRRIFAADRASGSPLPEEGTPVTCLAGRGSFWIAWNGDMYPCGMLDGQVARGDDFAAMWQQTKEMTAALRLPAACRSCVWRKMCPACAAVSHANFGNTDTLVEPLCRYMTAFADAYIALADAMPPDENSQGTSNESGPSGEPFVCL